MHIILSFFYKLQWKGFVRDLPLQQFSVRKYLSIRGMLGRGEYRTVLAYLCREVLGEEFLIKCSQDKNELSRMSRI